MNRKAALFGAGLLGLLGCNKTNGAYRASAGSVATSQDGKLVYAVDSDNQALLVAQASDGALVQSVPVGKDPVRVTVGADERIYVSNRGERSVSVISHDGFKELARVAVGVEPNGLSLSSDGSQLLVVSSTDLDDPSHGTLTAVDTKTLKPSWRVLAGQEPRGVAVVGDTAYISNLKQGRLTVVDLKSHQLTRSVDLNNADDPDPVSNPGSASVGGVTDVTPSPDGKRVYAPHVWQRNGAITIAAGTPGGYYQRGGPCGVGAIVSPGIATVETSDNTNRADSFSTCAASGGATDTSVDYPPSVLFPDRGYGTPSTVFQGPTVALVDPTNDWLFVVQRESNNVVVMPTHKRIGDDPSGSNVSSIIGVGAAPDGIALSKDGKTAYVYSQLDHSLSLIRHDETSSNPMALHEVSRVKLAGETLAPELVEGRKMFFSATDERISSKVTGIACSSCHVEGREDGHVWQFPDGPRRTPALSGRRLLETAPYHWTGIFPKLDDFYNETLIRRMGGSGLTHDESELITGYVVQLPAAENPLQNRADLVDTQVRGRVAFQKAGCEVCHAGETLTDNSVHDVGTLTSTDKLEETSSGFEGSAAPLTGLNTPSLLSLSRSGPYLHDGSALTLRARLDQSRFSARHGDTSQLTDGEIADLEQYLLSL